MRETLTDVEKLTRDIKSASKNLSNTEARYLVDLYYIWQEDRKRFANQARSLAEQKEPGDVIIHFEKQAKKLEAQCKSALDTYSSSDPVGIWAREQIGIGPVIAAGLLANIDITKAPTVGHIWAFAGLDPTKEWKKGEKRPWNASLKTLCWKIGESFVKISGNEEAYYGQVYVNRKNYETVKNENLEYKGQAYSILKTKKIGKTTDAYAAYSIGKLPKAHIHARAKRYAVKLFLSHLHHVWYLDHYGELPPKPYAIEHLGHAHYLAPPELK